MNWGGGAEVGVCGVGGRGMDWGRGAEVGVGGVDLGGVKFRCARGFLPAQE